MKPGRSSSIIAAVVLLGTAAVTEPAEAEALTVSKSGTLSCASGFTVAIAAKGTGLLKWYAPTSVFQQESQHNGLDYAETYYTYKYSTSWKVTDTGGYLDDDGTGAFCYNPDQLTTVEQPG
jgi:hypothetical protein